MLEAAIHEESEAALNRLLNQHSDLKSKIGNAYGYAMFPSVGRAGVVIGGAYGEGEVYEQGKPVGFATMSQITVGVQVGGQTFSELVLFNDKQSLGEFKTRGKLGFSANASVAIIKAAATATSSPKGIEAKAYSQGGLLLELSLGGSNFLFVPPMQKTDGKAEEVHGKEDTSKEQKNNNEKSEETSYQNQIKAKIAEMAKQEQNKHESDGEPNSSVLEKIKTVPFVGKYIPSSAEKVFHKVSEMTGKNSKLKKAASGLEKEIKLNKVLHQEVKGALKIISENHPEFKDALDKAYGYAVFPSVGKASLVLGGTYGKGLVYEQGKLVGYSGIVQVTIGVQLGGDTITEIVIFSDKDGLDRFKQSKYSFAANASAVIVKAAAGVTNSYQSDRVYTFSEGGLLIEAAIGFQKFIFRSAVMTKNQKLEDTNETHKAA